MTARSMLVKQIPCILCTMEGATQPFPTEADHCNEHQLAGKKRKGDEFQIAQCQWHHVGKLLPGWTRAQMTVKYGPSMAHEQKRFRERYGSDEKLVALTNAGIESL